MKEKTIWKPIAILLAVILCFSFHFALPVSADYENTHVNTGDQATDLVEVARTQVGYHEGTNNYTKYNVWFGSLNDYGYNYAWCQTFVAWCANQAGIPTSMIPRVSGTISGMDFFKKNETWKDAGITPEKGDIIYLHSKSSSGYHVGIVADVSGGQISTIEGNSSDRVAERSYSVGSSSIVGYGCPEYVRPNPPTYAKLSSDKQKYNLNEKITFSFDSDFATNYYFRICDDNGDVFAETMTTNTYSTTLPAGKYSASMSAFNNSGTAHAGWINFEVVDTAPTYAKLSSDKEKYNLNEKITFSFDSDFATNYYFRICNDNGDVFAETMTTNTYSTTLPAGKYSAAMSAFNDSGTAHSGWIFFEVVDTAPTYAKLSSDKQKYNLNEKITFSFDSDFAINYYFRICNDNGDVFAETMTTNTYSTTLPAGKYSAAMSAFNDSGTAHSGWIFFEVVDTAPTYAKLYSDKQKYNLNEKITFSFDSDFATNYYFRICDDNGDVFAEKMTANIYSTTLPAGKYSAAMSAFNDSGTAHSGWINFEVIIPGDLNQDGTLSLTDLIPLQQSLLRQTTLTADQAQLADYNDDGSINVLDLMLLKRALLS